MPAKPTSISKLESKSLDLDNDTEFPKVLGFELQRHL